MHSRLTEMKPTGRLVLTLLVAVCIAVYLYSTVYLQKIKSTAVGALYYIDIAPLLLSYPLEQQYY